MSKRQEGYYWVWYGHWKPMYWNGDCFHDGAGYIGGGYGEIKEERILNPDELKN